MGMQYKYVKIQKDGTISKWEECDNRSEVVQAFHLFAVCVYQFDHVPIFNLVNFVTICISVFQTSNCFGLLSLLYRRVSFAGINACVRAEALHDVIEINDGDFHLEPAAETMMDHAEDPKLTHVTAAN